MSIDRLLGWIISRRCSRQAGSETLVGDGLVSVFRDRSGHVGAAIRHTGRGWCTHRDSQPPEMRFAVDLEFHTQKTIRMIPSPFAVQI